MIRPVLLFTLLGNLFSAIAAPPADSAPPTTTVTSVGVGWAGSSVNVVANRRHALFTHGPVQFTAYYDPDGFMVLARRTRGEAEWTRQRTEHRGNVVDAHNAISLAVDGAGYLHVAWDHHGQPLNYARSRTPLGLELGPRQALTGQAEDRVTYPEFHRLPDGDLLCLYRDGGAGRGRLVLKRYRTARALWVTQQVNLIDGEGRRSPYWGATVDAAGRLHLTWIWRATPDVATNQDLAYAVSDDAGATWRSAEGAALALPFTAAGSAYARRIPPGRNLMNSPWITTDEQGRPYLTTYWSAAATAAPQFQVVWFDGRGWQTEVATARASTFTLAGTATKRPPISRGVLVVRAGEDPAHPAAHLLYRDDEHGERLLWRSTAGLGRDPWQTHALTEEAVGAWEPTMDPVAWAEHQELHTLVQVVHQRDGDDQRAAATPPTPVRVLEIQPAAPR